MYAPLTGVILLNCVNLFGYNYDVLTDGKLSEMTYYKGNKIFSLFVSFVIRVMLVMIGNSLRISSGTVIIIWLIVMMMVIMMMIMMIVIIIIMMMMIVIIIIMMMMIVVEGCNEHDVILYNSVDNIC